MSTRQSAPPRAKPAVGAPLPLAGEGDQPKAGGGGGPALGPRLFDRYIAVDWSATNQPSHGTNSIWIADWNDGLQPSQNPTTRRAAMSIVTDVLRSSLQHGQRTFIGFDFPFGYPAGGAAAVAGPTANWDTLWAWFGANVEDDDRNRSNRFELAGRINAAMHPTGPRFWGHHHQRRYDGMARHKPRDSYGLVAERRIAEKRARTAQPVWKLYGNGSVGSQAMLGIACLDRLRRTPRFADSIAIWPFQTDFARDLTRPVVIAEIYPSIVKATATAGSVKDQVQVENMVRLFAEADADSRLGVILGDPPNLSAVERASVVREEGWIVGVDL